MNKVLLYLFALIVLQPKVSGQYYHQYFDGADTSASLSILVNLDTLNVWQIGPPQKTIFDEASTLPNALMTDTVNTYPDSVSASAWFNVPTDLFTGFPAIAIQWNQKLDFETDQDGGIVEFSSDSGLTWENAFDHPEVYNYYGWAPANEGYLPSGEACFTGTDTLWRNVWLCFLYDYLNTISSLAIRYRLVSDTVNTNQEGWMIDNLFVGGTWFHPVAEQSKQAKFKLYPTLVDKTVMLQRIISSDELKIDNVSIISMNGQFIKQIIIESELEVIDVSDVPAGKYLLIIESNGEKETHEMIIVR